MTHDTLMPKVYMGILECPLRNGFLTFEYQPGDTLGELMQAVGERWGYNQGFIKKDGTNAGPNEREFSYDFGSGWLFAMWVSSNQYLALYPNDQLPVDSKSFSKAPETEIRQRRHWGQEDDYDLSRDESVQRGILNYENLSRPMSGERFYFPIKWSAGRPEREQFDVSLILIAMANGG